MSYIHRILIAICPIVYGLPFYFIMKEDNGLLVSGIGLLTLLFVLLHPRGNEHKEEDTE